MAKNHRHQKQLKSEKAKVKLKTKGSKQQQQQQLPKGLNITDASFKVKKIIIREQLKQQQAGQILSRRKLNVQDLLTRLQHYNCSVRQDAIRDLKEILTEHAMDVLNVHLSALLKGMSALLLDKEKPVRRESLKALNLILAAVSQDQLSPFSDILISYLKCAMTHIDYNIMEDSLLFLDVLVQHCDYFLANNSSKLLPYFLDMISKLRSQAQPGRQLTSNLNSKNTSIKWRLKVLNSLQQFIMITVKNKKNNKRNSSMYSPKVYYVKDVNGRYPIYSLNRLQVCSINFESTNSLDKISKSLDLDALQNYIDTLMPLMFDSWLEVSPKKSFKADVKLPICEEVAFLLKSITSIIRFIIEYLELLENDSSTSHTTVWFKSKFQNIFIKNLISQFPYVQQKSNTRVEKSRDEFAIEPSNDCLQQNLTLCYIYIWFTTIESNTKLDKLDKNLSVQVLDFLIDILEKWPNHRINAISSLMEVLRILFVDASTIWYKNKITLDKVLRSFINMYQRQNKKDLQMQLLTILKEIVMNYNLNDLHNEDSFKDLIKSLPHQLLKNSIHKDTVEMLNRVVLQYRQWIEEELEKHHESILENARVIEIVGSEDEESSRLMICNLLYFRSEQVYY